MAKIVSTTINNQFFADIWAKKKKSIFQTLGVVENCIMRTDLHHKCWSQANWEWCFSLLPWKRCSDRLSRHILRSPNQVINVNSRDYPFLGAKKECCIAHTLIFDWTRAFIVFGTVAHLCWGGFLTFAVMVIAQLMTEQSSPFRWLKGMTWWFTCHLSLQAIWCSV